MPLYEYECLKCGTHFDEIQKFSDAPLTEHLGCGGEVRKVLSAPAFQFKGSGWYITDYARAGKSDGEQKADKKAEAKEAKSDSNSKSEPKATPSESTKASTTETSKK